MANRVMQAKIMKIKASRRKAYLNRPKFGYDKLSMKDMYVKGRSLIVEENPGTPRQQDILLCRIIENEKARTEERKASIAKANLSATGNKFKFVVVEKTEVRELRLYFSNNLYFFVRIVEGEDKLFYSISSKYIGRERAQLAYETGDFSWIGFKEAPKE